MEIWAMDRRGDPVMDELERAKLMRTERFEWYRGVAARLLQSCEAGEMTG